MIDIEEVIKIHSNLIDKYGGIKGLRDKSLLESAINRAFSTFDKEELYKSSIDKASATIESIVKNHPFVDGNKRLGYFLCRAILLNDGFDIFANEDEKYNFIIEIAEGKSYQDIRDWLESKKIKLKKG